MTSGHLRRHTQSRATSLATHRVGSSRRKVPADAEVDDLEHAVSTESAVVLCRRQRVGPLPAKYPQRAAGILGASAGLVVLWADGRLGLTPAGGAAPPNTTFTPSA